MDIKTLNENLEKATERLDTVIRRISYSEADEKTQETIQAVTETILETLDDFRSNIIQYLSEK